MARAGSVGVVVMVYLDDILVVGRGKTNSCEQAASLVLHLRRERAVVSIKSTLEPTRRLVWEGKVVDFDTGVLSTAGAAWESLLAHRWRLAVGRRAQRNCGSSSVEANGWVHLVLVTRLFYLNYGRRCYGVSQSSPTLLLRCCAVA